MDWPPELLALSLQILLLSPRETRPLLFLSQLQLRVSFYFSPDLWLLFFSLSHFTRWVQLLPALEMLPKQYCHSDALTQLTMCSMCHLVASSRAGREGKLILIEFPLCVRYVSKPFPRCYSFNIIYTVVCILEPIILQPASGLSRSWLWASSV